MRRPARHSFALAVALLLACLPAGALLAADAPVQFAPADALVISWSRLQREPLAITFQNTTTAPQEVRVEVGDLGLLDRAGTPLPTAAVLRCGETVRLDPARAGGIRCEVAAPAPTLRPGTYAGSIVATVPATGTVLQRPFRLIVEGATWPRPVPVAEAWSVTAIRPFFGRGPLWVRDPYLPIRPGGGVNPANLALVPGGYLGFVAGANGHGAAVAWTGDTANLSDDISGLKLRLDGDGYPGKYEGAIDLDLADDKAGAVKLAVTVTDLVFWPILALALGIFLALAIQRYLGVLRTVWQLREREARAGVSLATAEGRFAGDALGQPYATLAIGKDALDRLATVRGQIDGLPRRFFAVLDTKDKGYTDLLDELQRLETAIGQWGGFASQLNGLKQALAAVRYNQFPVPLGAGGDTPAFLTAAEDLLDGGDLAVSAFAGQLEQVTKATALAKAWPDLADRNRRARNEIDAALLLPGLAPPLPERLRALKVQADRAWADLWAAKDSDELVKRKTLDALVEVERDMAGLRPSLPAPGALDAAPPQPAPGAGQIFFNNLGMASPAAVAQHYAQLRRAWDWALTAIALAVAIWTGLGALYFGKSFGTAIDYVNALCWGIATKAALEALTSILEKLFAGGTMPGMRGN